MRKIFIFLTAFLLTLTPILSYAESAPSDAPASDKNASLRILSELYEGQNTLVFSPLSLSVSLNMARLGADGETAAQLDAFLGDKKPGLYVLEDLAFSGVHMANTVFISPEESLLREYEDALIDEYDAEPVILSEGNIQEQVNEWARSQTDGMIDSLLQEEPAPETRLLLINALQMKADWAFPFKPVNTLPAVFHAPDGEIEVSSMNQQGMFAYMENDGIRSVLLPYEDSFLEMLILLPEDGNLENLIRDICSSPDEFIRDHLPEEKTLVALSLPNVRAESTLELKEALAATGVVDAFDQQKADFSNMTESAIRSQLHIGSIVQKSVLTVNESGTEAASATQIYKTNAADAAENEPVIMNVDRPFMMLIYDPMSGYVLFASAINNPA